MPGTISKTVQIESKVDNIWTMLFHESCFSNKYITLLFLVSTSTNAKKLLCSSSTTIWKCTWNCTNSTMVIPQISECFLRCKQIKTVKFTATIHFSKHTMSISHYKCATFNRQVDIIFAMLLGIKWILDGWMAQCYWGIKENWFQYSNGLNIYMQWMEESK